MHVKSLKTFLQGNSAALPLVLVTAYFVCSYVTRYPAIAANTLHLDDFWMGVYAWGGAVLPPDLCAVPPPDFRWLAFALYCIQSEIAPSWLLSQGPKIAAGLLVATAGVLNFLILRRWRMPVALAALAPLVWICHPIVNEITLWNTTWHFCLWLGLVFVAFLVWNRSVRGKRVWLAWLLLLPPALSYEVYLSAFLGLVIVDMAFQRVADRRMNLAASAVGIMIFIGAGLFYLLVVWLTKTTFGDPPGRGLFPGSLGIDYLIERVHSVVNLFVNVVMPLIGYYAGIESAWSAWKWFPLLLIGAIFCTGWRDRGSIADAVIVSTLSLSAIVIPTLWVFAASDPSEAWRVSVPVLVTTTATVSLSVFLLWRMFPEYGAAPQPGRVLAVMVLAGLLAIEVPVTFAEARLRVDENRLDREIVANLKTYWASRSAPGEGVRVGVILSGDTRRGDMAIAARNITKSYLSRGYLSALDFDYSWRGFLAINDLHVIELDDRESLFFHEQIKHGCLRSRDACRPELFDELYAKCLKSPDFRQPQTSATIVNDEHRGISVVCH